MAQFGAPELGILPKIGVFGAQIGVKMDPDTVSFCASFSIDVWMIFLCGLVFLSFCAFWQKCVLYWFLRRILRIQTLSGRAFFTFFLPILLLEFL